MKIKMVEILGIIMLCVLARVIRFSFRGYMDTRGDEVELVQRMQQEWNAEPGNHPL